MRKVAIVFVVAVFVPSLVLAWLAVRSLRDQQFVLERQRALLYQGATDALARSITDHVAARQREFNVQVETLAASHDPRALAASFDRELRNVWPLADVGFCVTLGGLLLSPAPSSSPEASLFCSDNAGFLGNLESAEVYWHDLQGNTPFNPGRLAQPLPPGASSVPIPVQAASNSAQLPEPTLNYGKVQSRKVNPFGQIDAAQSPEEQQTLSKVVPSEAEFRQLIGDSTEGMIARFLQNKLRLMFWHRLERDPQLVFGAQLDLPQLTEGLRELVRLEPLLHNEICIALLDDNARPVALTHPEFQANWKRPFVATEIGEALPHWEMAAYLLNPADLSRSAQILKLTLGLLVGVLLLAITIGSWLITLDLKRQLTLVRQKTDFVSNVSHELKTPLTSIRMFSELLAEGRVTDAARQRSYLNIITAEAARLTRLINNVLDFSRMERGEKKYRFHNCELGDVVRDTVESYRPHLENNGFQLDCTVADDPLPVRGDPDALAQVLVNLLSNAEKYSNAAKEIAVRAIRRDTPLPYAEVQVLDRGSGIPCGAEEKIFEKFYRAHDSLSSGIQGSGLGLTLARQIARAHGGDVVCEPRTGGGSSFALRLPLTPADSGSERS